MHFAALSTIVGGMGGVLGDFYGANNFNTFYQYFHTFDNCRGCRWVFYGFFASLLQHFGDQIANRGEGGVFYAIKSRIITCVAKIIYFCAVLHHFWPSNCK